MAKEYRRNSARPPQRGVRRRVDEEYFDKEYDTYDYERSVSLANRGCLIAFAGAVLAAAGVLLFAFLLVTAEMGGKNAPAASGLIRVDIETGNSGATAVSALLEDVGLVSSKSIFHFYLRFNAAALRAGRFDIPAKSSYEEILAILTAPIEDTQAETVDVVFPPGRTVWEYADICEDVLGIPAQAFVDAANDIEAYEDIEFLGRLDFPSGTYFKAEGYMAPNTYNFYADEDDPYVVCRKLYEQFEDNIEAMTFITGSGVVDFYTRLQQQDLSLRQAVTLASIVEKEASKADEDQARVAGVFWNRLRSEDLPVNDLPRRTLGSDVTFFYINNTISRSYGGSGADGDWQLVPGEFYYAYATADNDPQVNEGLPAGPVTNPGESALRSALMPEQNDYFYFLTDDYGTYYYAATWAGHSANVATMEKMNAQFEEENGAGAQDG